MYALRAYFSYGLQRGNCHVLNISCVGSRFAARVVDMEKRFELLALHTELEIWSNLEVS